MCKIEYIKSNLLIIFIYKKENYIFRRIRKKSGEKCRRRKKIENLSLIMGTILLRFKAFKEKGKFIFKEDFMSKLRIAITGCEAFIISDLRLP